MTTSTNKLTLQAITDMARSVQTYVSGQLYFSGLHDTPTGYLSGYYVRANETGIEYIHPTGVAKELSEHLGAGNGSFTGLQDTPSDYLSGYYLESTATGISYIDPTGLARKIPTIPNTYESIPEEPIEKDGEIIKVGCDLYLSCDKEWIKFSNDSNAASLDDDSSYPACVNTVAQALDYQEYKDSIMFDKIGDLFDQSLNGDNVEEEIYNVCLLSSESNSTVKIDETTYPWGLFQEPQTVNITATPGTAVDKKIVFSHWEGAGATLGNSNSAQTTLEVDKDLSVTGFFNSVYNVSSAYTQEMWQPYSDGRKDSGGNYLWQKSANARYGDDVAISTDGRFLYIGRPDDHNYNGGGSGRGAVYIWESTKTQTLTSTVTTWTFKKIMYYSSPNYPIEDYNHFGHSISTFGNLLLIGSKSERWDGNRGGEGRWTLYEYNEDSDNWDWVAEHIDSKWNEYSTNVSLDQTGIKRFVVVKARAGDGAGDYGTHIQIWEEALDGSSWAVVNTIQPPYTPPYTSNGRDLDNPPDFFRTELYGDFLVVSNYRYNYDIDTGLANGNINHDNIRSWGKVYIYKRQENNTWSIVDTLTTPSESYDYFGHDLAIDGDKMAIGARLAGNSSYKRVFAYTLQDDGTWAYGGPYTSNRYAGDISVALRGDQLVIGDGARHKDSRTYSVGRVEVHKVNY